MPTFLPSPLLLNSAEEPATGVIATRVTSWFDNDAGIVTPTMAAGIIRGGVVYDVTGYEPFVIPTTPGGVAVEIVIQLDEKRDGRQQLRDLPRRIVSVPDQATVTWDDLVDVVPVGTDTQYSMPSWAAAILGVPAQVQGVVAAAQAAAAVAVAAKNAALAVGTTNAGVIASVLADPTSAPSIGLAEKYEPDDGGRPVGKDELKAFLRVQTPEMFGARPDIQANDTVAINAAFDWAMRHKGVTVLLDATTYFISGSRVDYSSSDWAAQPTNGEPYGFAAPSVIGQGKRVSILKQIAGSTGDVFTISGKTGTEAGPANNNKVNGFRMEGVGIVGTPGGGNGIRMRSIVSSSFENLWIGHTGKSGIKIDREYFVSGQNDEYAYNLSFNKIDLVACALWGFEHTRSAAVQSVLRDVAALNCGTVGVGQKGGFLLCPTNTTLDNCSAIGCGTGSSEGRGVLVVTTTSETSTTAVAVFQTLRLEGNSQTGGYQLELQGSAAPVIRDVNVVTTPGNYAHPIGIGVRDTGIGKEFTQLAKIEGGFISILGITSPGQRAIVLGKDSRRTELTNIRFENQGQDIGLRAMVDNRGFATTVNGIAFETAAGGSTTPTTPTTPDPVDPNPTPTPGTGSFAARLDNIATAPLRILWLGDSMKEGSEASTLDKRTIAVLARMQNSLKGVAGSYDYIPGFYEFDRLGTGPLNQGWLLTNIGKGTDYGTQRGLGRRAIILNADGKAEIVRTASKVRLYFHANSASDVVTVSIDGTATDYTGKVGTWAETVVQGASASRVITVEGQAGTSQFLGGEFWNGFENKGLSIIDGSKHGTMAWQFNTASGGNATWTSMLALMDKPDLIVPAHITNDSKGKRADNTTPIRRADFKQDVLNNINQARAISGWENIPVGLNVPWEVRQGVVKFNTTSSGALGTWAEYTAPLYELANSLPYTAMLNESLEITDTTGLLADGIHGNDAGQAESARVLLALLKSADFS